MVPSDPVGAAEVSWHSGDGSVADGGNMTSLSIEIIMNESPEHDKMVPDWPHGCSGRMVSQSINSLPTPIG